MDFEHTPRARALIERLTRFMDDHVYQAEGRPEQLEPLKARARAELALMEDLIPLLRRKAGGQQISGLEVYEDA